MQHSAAMLGTYFDQLGHHLGQVLTHYWNHGVDYGQKVGVLASTWPQKQLRSVLLHPAVLDVTYTNHPN